jgi:uncharacterized protein YndB with AHSA1/START domain
MAGTRRARYAGGTRVTPSLPTLRLMPITDVTVNQQDATITITADYDVPVERLWEAYADPRQLERFWGPAEWPATFTRHEFTVGGEARYHMTGPDGQMSRGMFRFLAIEPPHRMEMEDQFVDDTGAVNTDLPGMRMEFAFEATDSGSRFTSTTWFPDREALDQLLDMGMLEGTKSAMSQIDAVVAEQPPARGS